MNNLSSLSTIIDPTSPVLLALPFVFAVFKLLFLVGLALYIIYALVIFRQISLMSRSVTTALESVLKLLGLLHLGAAIVVWILAFLTRVS